MRKFDPLKFLVDTMPYKRIWKPAVCLRTVPTTGLEINEKNPVAFCDKIRKFSRNFSRKIAALHCVVSGLAKKYEPAILLCKETADNGEWLKEWRSARNITAKLLYNYAIFRENSQRETK